MSGLTDGRELSRFAVAQFHRYVADSFILMHLTRAGAEVLTGVDSRVVSLGSVPTHDDRPRVIDQRVDESAALAHEELVSDFPLSNGHVLLGAWAAMESCIEGVCVGWLVEDQLRSGDAAFQKIRVPLGASLYTEEPDRSRLILGLLKREINPLPKQGADQFEVILSAIGLDGPVDRDLRRLLIYAHALRNLIADEGGTVDARFAVQCPSISPAVGTKFRLSSPQVDCLLWAMIRYVVAVHDRTRVARGHEPNSSAAPEGLDLTPSHLLAAFEEYADLTQQ